MEDVKLSAQINYDAYVAFLKSYLKSYELNIDSLIPTRSTILALTGIEEVYSNTPQCEFFVNSGVYKKLSQSSDFKNFKPFSVIEMPTEAGIVCFKEISNREENIYRDEGIILSRFMSLRNTDVLSIIRYLRRPEWGGWNSVEDLHNNRVFKFIIETVPEKELPYYLLPAVYKIGLFSWWQVSESVKESVRNVISGKDPVRLVSNKAYFSTNL